MLTVHRIGEIQRIHMSSWRSRSVGYAVSAYLWRGVLIDTGFPSAARELSTVLDELRPRAVTVTHWHEDHAGNVELIAKRGLPVAASDATLSTLRALPPIGLYRRAVWGTLVPLRGAIQPAELPGLELIPAPGHSHDHHVVWDPDSRTLFSGDLFLGVKVRALHRSEDPRTHAASLRRIAALRPRVMLDAHRGEVPNPESALGAKADWIEEMIHAIERFTAEGRSDRAIAHAVLGPPDAVTAFTLGDLSRLNFVRAVQRGARESASRLPTANAGDAEKS